MNCVRRRRAVFKVRLIAIIARSKSALPRLFAVYLVVNILQNSMTCHCQRLAISPPPPSLPCPLPQRTHTLHTCFRQWLARFFLLISATEECYFSLLSYFFAQLFRIFFRFRHPKCPLSVGSRPEHLTEIIRATGTDNAYSAQVFVNSGAV